MINIIVDSIKFVMFICIGFVFGLGIETIIGMTGLKTMYNLEPYILVILSLFFSIGIFSLIVIFKKEKIEGVYYDRNKKQT